jgi:acetyl-CoA carboxylase biotin carboxyl carrier protein
VEIRKIKQLIEIIQGSDIVEIELIKAEESIRINRFSTTTPEPIAITIPLASTESIPSPVDPAVVEPRLNTHVIESPMVGTFYHAASTTDAPFVEVGQSVSVGDTLCIIEAMKILNQIEADGDGVIKQILVDDSQSIEVGQPLFIIE